MTSDRDRAQELFDALSSSNRVRATPGGVELQDDNGRWQRISAGSAQGTEQVIRTRRTRPQETTTGKVMVLWRKIYVVPDPARFQKVEYYVAGDRPEPVLVHTITYSGEYDVSTGGLGYPPVDLHEGYIASNEAGDCIVEIRHSRNPNPDNPGDIPDPYWISSYAYRVTNSGPIPVTPGGTWRGAISHVDWRQDSECLS